MKQHLIKLFWPVLRFFETDVVAVNYKKSHRVALNVVGVLFVVLSLVSAVTTYLTGELGSLIPVIIFATIGAIAIIVGSLGSNGAVCKIWGSKT